jgi:broad specificity phosphatase PhoE
LIVKKIYLIRHGETNANREGVFRGRYDIPLSGNGLEQARALAGYFEEIQVDRVFCSPLQRAAMTAEIAFNGIDVELDELINNLDVGEWTGILKADLQKKDPESWNKWIAEPEDLRFPGGESLNDVSERTKFFLKKLQGEKFETAAVVSHRSVLKCLIAAALGLERRYFWRFHLENASVSLLLHDETRGYTLSLLNDTKHLKSFVFEWV